MIAVSGVTVAGRLRCPSCGEAFSGDAVFCPNDGARLASDAPPVERRPSSVSHVGIELAGHIKILERIGTGAMGRVYRAFQDGIERDVAVKILHRELGSNEQLVARFHREAKVASRLSHPNVVHVYLSGQLETGELYIVMEFLDGASLMQALESAGGAFPLSRALHVTLQICSAVGEAHGQGIVHRDLKPENVMLVSLSGDPDFIKILDFGIARLSWGDPSMATAAGLIFGTARYISPEGARGDAVGPEGDVYSIATLLYQMLSGRTPFEGEQAVGLLIQQIHDAPPSLRSISRAGYVPEPLERVIMRNLSKEPSDRAKDAHALGEQLEAALREAGLNPNEIQSARSPRGRVSSRMHVPSLASTKRMEPGAALGEALQGARRERQSSGIEAASPARPGGTEIASETVKWTPESSPAGDWASFAISPSAGVADTLDDDDVRAPPDETKSTRFGRRQTVDVGALGIDPPAERARQESSPGERTSFSEVEIPRRRSSPALTAIAYFVVGIAAALGIWFGAKRLGWIGGRRAPDPLAAELKRIDRAEAAGQWDQPAGENVLELLERAKRTAPSDPRVKERRVRANQALVNIAIDRAFAGRLREARRYAVAAARIDPSDDTAKRLVREYDAKLHEEETSKLDPMEIDAGMTVEKPKHGATPHAHHGTTPSAKKPSAKVGASPHKPHLGQTVRLEGSVDAEVSKAEFVITGPGLAKPAVLDATPDGRVLSASFTFLDRGTFDVQFVADVKAKGPVSATTRVEVVGASGAHDPAGEPTPGSTSTGPVQWL